MALGGDSMGAKYTNAQKRAATKYLAEKTDLIQLRVPRGGKERYKAHAERLGKSLTALIVELLEREIAENSEGKSDLGAE